MMPPPKPAVEGHILKLIGKALYGAGAVTEAREANLCLGCGEKAPAPPDTLAGKLSLCVECARKKARDVATDLADRLFRK